MWIVGIKRMIKERGGGSGDGQPFPMYKFSVRAFFNSFL